MRYRSSPLASKTFGRFAVLLAGALSLLAGQALAHRIPECVTTVAHRGTTLEVTHRLHRHDARRLLAQTQPLSDDEDLDALTHRAAFALLVEARFALRAGDKVLALKLLGAEVDGDYVYVYQETAVETLDELEVHHRVLGGAGITELYRVQGTQTARFVLDGKDRWQLLSGVESPVLAG